MNSRECSRTQPHPVLQSRVLDMNRTGSGDVLSGTLLYVVLVVLFAIGIFMIIAQHKNNAAQWEEFYAKELALLLDQAKLGDRYTLDIQHASELAVANGVENPSYIITFDGKTREVVVRLTLGGETRFSYFNDVVVSDVRVELGKPTNKLQFTVVGVDA